MQAPDLKGLTVLIVEDEPLLRRQLAAEVERLGGDAILAGTLETARKAMDAGDFDFLLLDVHLPDGQATSLLKEGRFPRGAGVIIMTAHGDVAGATEALRLGALDYLVKPFEPAQVALALARVRRERQQVRIDEHRRTDGAPGGEGFFFGTTLTSVERQLEKIVAADQRMQEHLPPVLIQGETGTGKTTIARWLHNRGPRSSAPLVEVNCSALPDTLAESELFGHERGAFTDARNARMGLFEAANGGTLFLDELPSLSPLLQAKVLKALEDHRIRRLGGNREIPVDVRVIAAGPADLAQLVAQGTFRQDLYHRLDLYRVALPALRDRRDDLLPLADLLLQRIARRHRMPVRAISPAGRQRLLHSSWPGNVRELSHELERALVFEEGPELNLDHLAGPGQEVPQPAVELADWFNPRFEFPASGFSLEAAINRLIQQALAQTNQNVSAAARLLGVSRDYVRYRLQGQKPTTNPDDPLS
jgi:DNA-binding NtrC family response regulator